jgi:hypothetical protein
MFKRSGVPSGLFVVLTVGVWGCGRTALLPNLDDGLSRRDAAGLDSAALAPDADIVANPDLPPDSATDRTTDVADLALDRAREAGDTAQVPDGPAGDRAFDGAPIQPDLAVDTRAPDAGDAGSEAPPPGLSVLAGTLAGPDGLEGVGSSAQFTFPAGVALDGAGNLYVADTGNCTIRQIVIATGNTTTVAGAAGICEGGDGNGLAAHFQAPAALAMDLAGRLLVADLCDNTVRRIDLSTKQVTTIVGHSGRWQTIPGPWPAYVSRPAGLAVLLSGDIAISDENENLILLAHF